MSGFGLTRVEKYDVVFLPTVYDNKYKRKRGELGSAYGAQNKWNKNYEPFGFGLNEKKGEENITPAWLGEVQNRA